MVDRVAGNARHPDILVYVPDASESREYGQLLRAALPKARVIAAESVEELDQHIGSTEVLTGWKFPRSSLAKASGLRWIHKLSAGVDDVINDPALRNAAVTRSDGAIIASRIVEYVMGCVFAWTQRFETARRQQQAAIWRYYRVGLARGATIGIAGLGDVGSSIARGCTANGMTVTGWVRSPRQDSSVSRLYAGPEQMPEFLAACDYLVLALPATPQTRHIMGEAQFAGLKPGAVFINVGRGTLVDEAALIRALEEKRLAAAFLDVTEVEPLPAQSPLWTMENVFITPHVSGPVVPREVLPLFVENYERYRQGLPFERTPDRAKGY